MTVLVTGGDGYIGSHLVARLVDAGREVVVVDDPSTGHADAVHDRAPLIVGDVGDRATIAAVPWQRRRERGAAELRARSGDRVAHLLLDGRRLRHDVCRKVTGRSIWKARRSSLENIVADAWAARSQDRSARLEGPAPKENQIDAR